MSSVLATAGGVATVLVTSCLAPVSDPELQARTEMAMRTTCAYNAGLFGKGYEIIAILDSQHRLVGLKCIYGDDQVMTLSFCPEKKEGKRK